MGRKVLERLREGAAGTIRTLTQYSYDPLGRPQCTAVRMNPALYAAPPVDACAPGTEGSFGPDRVTHNVYDLAGQLLQEQRGYGTYAQQTYATYTYGDNGERLSLTDANGNRAEMHYDGHGRQDRWTFPSPTTPGTVNAADFEAYGYDNNGNRTSLRKRGGSTLAYDPLGRLYAVAGTSATTRFLYDGDDLVAEYDAAGKRQHIYVHGSGDDVPLVWYHGASRSYLLADERGSIVAIADYPANLLATNSYDEWGIPAATNSGRFQYIPPPGRPRSPTTPTVLLSALSRAKIGTQIGTRNQASAGMPWLARSNRVQLNSVVI